MALESSTKLASTVNKCLLHIKQSNLIFKVSYSYGQYKFRDLRGVERNKKVAIILTGCGILDGTDPFEASMAAHCVSESGMVPIFYATRLLFKAVDYSKKIITKKRRSSFVESARIARGDLKDLCELRTTDVGAVIIPGGYGIGTTLSNYEKKHVDFQVHPHLAGIIMDFMACKIPMGFIGIAAILAARLYPQVQITLGNIGDKWPYCWAIDHAKDNGAEVVLTSEYDTIVDEWYHVFSTPGFLYNGRYKDIHLGISFMVSRMQSAALWSTPEPSDDIRFH